MTEEMKREVALLREQHERLEAVVTAARKLMDERKAGSATLFLNMAALTEALAAIDTAAPETPANTELVLSRKDAAENSGGRR